MEGIRGEQAGTLTQGTHSPAKGNGGADPPAPPRQPFLRPRGLSGAERTPQRRSGPACSPPPRFTPALLCHLQRQAPAAVSWVGGAGSGPELLTPAPVMGWHHLILFFRSVTFSSLPFHPSSRCSGSLYSFHNSPSQTEKLTEALGVSKGYSITAVLTGLGLPD